MTNTAILVIDTQKAILDKPGLERRAETMAALDATVERIARLIARARQSHLPVIFVQHAGPAGHRLAVDTPGWEIRSEIAARADETIVRKTACDSFFETTLGEELERRGIRHLIIAGCMTQFCVDTTVRSAVTRGYDVTLVSDGHMTTDDGALRFEQIIAHHNRLLDGFDAGRPQAHVRPLGDLLAEL